MAKKIRQILFTPEQAKALERAETGEAPKHEWLEVPLCAYVPLKHRRKLPYVDEDGGEGPCEHEPCPCRAASKYATDKYWFEQEDDDS